MMASKPCDVDCEPDVGYVIVICDCDGDMALTHSQDLQGQLLQPFAESAWRRWPWPGEGSGTW